MKKQLSANLTMIVGSVGLVVVTASCTPVKADDPNYSSHSSYGGDSTYICEDAVTDRIKREKGYDARIQFDRANVYPSSKRTDEVTGNGVIRDGRRYTNFDYRCDVNTRSNRVTRVDVDYRNDRNDRQVERLCHDRIEEKVQREVGRDVRLNIISSDTDRRSNRQVRVSGEANVSQGRRNGKIRYVCEVDLRKDEVDSSSIRWLIPFNDPVHTGADECHQAIIRKAQRNGADTVKIKTTEEQRTSRDTIRIFGTASLQDRREWKSIEYACRINTRDDRLETANYKFISIAPEPVLPVRPDNAINDKCEKALRGYAISLMRSDNDSRVMFIKFENQPRHSSRDGRTLVEGMASFRVNGIPKELPYRCVYDHHTDKVESTDIKLK